MRLRIPSIFTEIPWTDTNTGENGLKVHALGMNINPELAVKTHCYHSVSMVF
jgi:hypothetical protein